MQFNVTWALWSKDDEEDPENFNQGPVVQS